MLFAFTISLPPDQRVVMANTWQGTFVLRELSELHIAKSLRLLTSKN